MSLNGLLSSISVELKLFLRDPATPTVVACLLGLSFLLLPGNDASYTILSFSKTRPLMDESTYLFAAGIVLSTLIFPWFIMAFGTLTQRDCSLGLQPLLVAQKHLSLTLMLARFLANNIKLLLINLLVMLFLSGIILLRFEQPPSTWAVVLFTSLSTISGGVAIALAIVLEHLLGKARNLHIGAVFSVWTALIFLFASGAVDVFGFSLITSVIPPEYAENGMSVGFIEITSVNSFEWYQLPAPGDAGAFMQQNLSVLFAFSLLALAVVHIPQRHSSATEAAEQDSIQTVPDSSQFSAHLLTQSGSSFTTGIRSVFVWLAGQNKAALMLGLLTFIVSFTVQGDASLLISCWLAVVFLLFRKQKMQQTMGTLLLEHSTASLKTPSPELIKLAVLSALLLVPLTPLILTLPAMQFLQLALAVIYLLAWMLLCFSIWRRPVLGMSVFAIFWYGFGLNSMPPNIDLLALHSQSLMALTTNLIILIVLLTMLYRGSRTGFIW